MTREYGSIDKETISYDATTNELTLVLTLYPANLDIYNSGTSDTSTIEDTTTLEIYFYNSIGTSISVDQADLDPPEDTSSV